ncbi:FAD-dependent oxidoreductase [Salinibacterium sp. GXW1014]|uniref:FAD-dependent oxidoreductase n=1 Tax=Salinibacterium sp. GXW1014 TaxID=3377838 RepID=UPI00383BF514
MHDVAIVGGGPVGMLLAVLLAQEGRDVAAFEERDTISPRARAIGIHPPSVEALAEAGVEVPAHGRPIADGVAMADGRVLGAMPLAGVYALAQQHVERMLRARLATLAPGSLRLGRRVLGLHPVSGGHRLDVEGGAAASARLVVAADGLRSTIRELVGVPVVRRRGVAHYLMADVDGDALGDRALLAFEREGVVESFPLPGGRRRWVARVAPPMPEADFEALAAVVRARTGRVLDSPSPVSAFTAKQGLAARTVHFGSSDAAVVLIGDAAHEISPIGGQGLNLGWLEARALARVLTGGPGTRDALAAFEAERMRATRRAIAQAAFNTAMGRALSRSGHAARSLAIRSLGAPPLARHLADAFTMRTL